MREDAPVRRIRPDERTEGQSTSGMHREQAIETEGMWAGYVTTDAGAVSGWHHHGDYESSIYIVSGALRMEFGAGGEQVLDAGPGDFLYVPPRAIHREGNPSEEPSTIVVVRAGTGEAVINVDGPASG
jgi:uncharacterized RmlC-like cupin family protein